MAKKINIFIDERTRILILAGAIALATLIICFQIVGLRIRQLQSMRSKISEETEKLVLRKDVAKIDNLLKKYYEHLYRDADRFALRDSIYVLAKETAVDIISIRPLPPDKIGNFSKTSFDVEVKCSYRQLGNFIARIESSALLTTIDKLSVSNNESQLRGAYDTTEEPLYEEAAIARASFLISTYSLGP